MSNTLLPCPFCGKQIAEIGTCKNMEECEHFEECPAVEPYVCVVCSINRGGCGASTGYQEGVEQAIAAWNRRCGKDTNVATNADRIRSMNDEELAEFLRNIRDCGDYEELKLIGGVRMDYVSVIDWLQQPAKEERHETD